MHAAVPIRMSEYQRLILIGNSGAVDLKALQALHLYSVRLSATGDKMSEYTYTSPEDLLEITYHNCVDAARLLLQAVKHQDPPTYAKALDQLGRHWSRLGQLRNQIDLSKAVIE